MTYNSSRQALRELDRDARFEDDTGHYNFRRWTANELNSMWFTERDMMIHPRYDPWIYGISHNGADYLLAENFTGQERQRVLGQSGDAFFEKHYQSQFIARDLQHVVLLRPSQYLACVIHVYGSSQSRLSSCSIHSILVYMHEAYVCSNHYVQFMLATSRFHGPKASESSLGGINWVDPPPPPAPLFPRHNNSRVYETMCVGPIHDGMYLDQNNISVTNLLHSSKLPY